MVFFIFLLGRIFSWPNEGFAQPRPLHFLHLTFHKGCAREIETVAKLFAHEVTTWWIPGLEPGAFDGISYGNALYNIDHVRAASIWNLHQKTFEQFDGVITSDTAALARIFLQNNFEKPLIIWICNRIDYCDAASLDCLFPDPEFYQLFNAAHLKKNVTIIAYTPFEHIYAKKMGIETQDLVITPCAPDVESFCARSCIPSDVLKQKTFFLPPYHNETIFMNLAQWCDQLKIPVYCGRYNGPEDLRDFKGIIHLPYAWSNLAFFENIACGIPYFIPSRRFFKMLLQQSGYWHINADWLFDETYFDLSEWYQPGREAFITYFDSWEDLKHKIDTAVYPVLRKKTLAYAEQLRSCMLKRWAFVFEKYVPK